MSNNLDNSPHEIDLRGVACPLNFVKTKLYLDKLTVGEKLAVILDGGEAVENLSNSVGAEGHEVSNPEQLTDGSFRLAIKKLVLFFLFFLLSFYLSCLLTRAKTISSVSQTHERSKETVENNPQDQVQAAKKACALAPADLVKRLHLARVLLRAGDKQQAAIEYLNASVLNPKTYIVYHEMLLANPATEQIDEAIDRLNRLDDIKAKQLVGATVLSELYEKNGDYYQAARVLVDSQYSHNIPQKFLPQITSRIHVLLSKDKDTRTVEKANEKKTNIEEADYTPVTPVPMPDTGGADAPTSRLRSNKALEGYGHAQLLP